MTRLDTAFVRSQFPAFAEDSLKDIVFLENAGGSYMCGPVMERLDRFHHQCKIQPYYPNPVSMQAGSMMDEAYASLAPWLNVTPGEIYFGPSTSQNTYVLSRAVLGWLRPGDEVIVTNQDHEANIGSWRRLEQAGMVVKQWSVDPTTGALDVDQLRAMITDRTRLLAFTHCSNILGAINPVAEWCAVARERGVRTVVDGVSYAGHGLPDVPALGCDIYLFSLYKVYGPHQGVMVIRPDMAELLANQGHFFHDDVRVKRLMPAGPDHAQIGAVKGVADYFEAVYAHHGGDSEATAGEKAEVVRALLKGGEREPLAQLLDSLQGRAGLRLVGPGAPDRRSATVSVAVQETTPARVAEALGKRGILCGAGHFYSVRLLEALGMDPDVGVLRFSLVHYTSMEDVTKLIDALDSVL